MNRKELKSISPLNAAYIAGFFDGEGCMAIYERAARHSGEGAVNPTFYISLSISNTHSGVLSHIQKLAGGTVCNYVRKNNRSRPIYRWAASSCEAAHIVKCLLPFLVIKKDQALAILEFDRIVQDALSRGHKGMLGRPAFTAEELHERRVIMRRVKELKRYGF